MHRYQLFPLVHCFYQYASMLPSLSSEKAFLCLTPVPSFCSPLTAELLELSTFTSSPLILSPRHPSFYCLYSAEIVPASVPRVFMLPDPLGISQSSFLPDLQQCLTHRIPLSFFWHFLPLTQFSNFPAFPPQPHHSESLMVDISQCLNILSRCSLPISRL